MKSNSQVHPIFEEILNSITGPSNEEVLPTDKGPMTIPNIIDSLSYSCYEHNRKEGMTHEQLISIGLGNDKMKEAYERSLTRIKQ